MAVHPEKFRLVIASAGVLDFVERKVLDKFVFRVDFLFGAVVPAKASEII